MQEKSKLYKKQIIVPVVLAILIALFGYAAYAVRGLSVAMNGNNRWKASGAVGLITAPTATATSTPLVPTHLRVDISVGTTGQLFVSWNKASGATYYNLQRSTSSDSGYTSAVSCKNVMNTTGYMVACRDGSLAVGTFYYYRVQACNSNGCSDFSTAASNVPVASNCTATQIPDLSGVTIYPAISLLSSTVDPTIQYLPTNNQYAAYASRNVPRKNLLVVQLPGSDETCGGGGAFGNTAKKLGFDWMCVNYTNFSSQDSICSGDPACFGNISQAKLDATGPCSQPNGAHCGKDPKTKQPWYNSNPADAVTQRISMMLQYLNNNGYNKNGTNWGSYLSSTTPLWDKIIIGGHSQGGDMGTFAGYEHVINRAYNLSAPPQATPVNGVETGATYFSTAKATDMRNFYGFVSVNDLLYQQGVYSAVWKVLGFTAANNDAEVKLNTSAPIGLDCNSGAPSHNFSTSALVSQSGGHNDTLNLWNEDVFKFMLTD